MRYARVFNALLMSAAILAAVPSLNAAEPVPGQNGYVLMELRFPDSPDDPKIQVGGLSATNVLAGSMLAGDGHRHLFVFEAGKLQDLHKSPEGECGQVFVTRDGVVLALESTPPAPDAAPAANPARGNNARGNQPRGNAPRGNAPARGGGRVQHLLVYKDGKLSEVSVQGNITPPLAQPTYDGDFIIRVQGAAPEIVYSTKTGSQVSVTDAQNPIPIGGGRVIGAARRQQPGAPPPAAGSQPTLSFFVQQGTTRTWFETPVSTGPASAGILPGASRGNSSGQAIVVAANADKVLEPWLLDSKTMKATKIPLPADLNPTTFTDASIDNTGMVILDAGPYKGNTTAFFYLNGKLTPLKEIMPELVELQYHLPMGRLFGTRIDGLLTRFDGKTETPYKSSEGLRRTVSGVNAYGDPYGTYGDISHGEILQFRGGIFKEDKILDVNSFAPADAKFMLGGVMAGNDGGVIVAPAAKFPNKENEAFKPATYVLWPKDLPTSQPAPSPAAAPASPATAPARGATPAVPATPARGR